MGAIDNLKHGMSKKLFPARDEAKAISPHEPRQSRHKKTFFRVFMRVKKPIIIEQQSLVAPKNCFLNMAEKDYY